MTYLPRSEWLGDFVGNGEQIEATRWLLKVKSGLLVAKQGTGKTIICTNLIKQFEPRTVLVIGELTNKVSTWKKTLNSYLPKYLATEHFGNFFKSKRNKILLVHYAQLRNKNFLKRLLSLKFDLAIVDESHKIKNPLSQQSEAVAKLASVCNRRIAMTGTPIDKESIDLWAQIRFVRPELITESWEEFKSNECRSAGFKGKGFKIKDDSDFLTRIDPYCYYLGNEFLNLKPFKIVEHAIPLKTREAAFYKRMEKDAVLELQGELITAPIRLAVIAKLQQMCCGYINHEKKPIRVGDSKLIYTLHLIDELPKPIVIFCKYSYDIKTLLRYIDGYKIEVINGKTAKTKRPKIIEDFQDGKLDILLCEIGTGGVGIDLYRACNAIGYSYRHSLIQWEQAIARMWRYGQTQAVTMHRLQCTAFGEPTVESDIVEAKNSKTKTSEKIFKRIQKRVDMR